VSWAYWDFAEGLPMTAFFTSFSPGLIDFLIVITFRPWELPSLSCQTVQQLCPFPYIPPLPIMIATMTMTTSSFVPVDPENAASLQSAANGFDHVFSNEILLARHVFSSKNDPYHLIGLAVCGFLEAALGMEVSHMITYNTHHPYDGPPGEMPSLL
jgi:hypothetical protein